MQAESLSCYHFLYTGNCINRLECAKTHPNIKLKTKTKLRHSKKNDFVPDKSVAQQIITQTPQLAGCTCCKERPFGCKGSDFCRTHGKCFCVSHSEMEAMIQSLSNPKSKCDCCRGDPANCPTVLCRQLGMCQCQMREEMESATPNEEADYVFVSEYADCSCCNGYIYGCGNPMCMDTGVCGCTL